MEVVKLESNTNNGSVRLNRDKDVTKTISPIRDSFLLKTVLVDFRK